MKLSLVDANDDPANDRMCEAVYNHIVSPDDRTARLLPTGTAELTVVPAESLQIAYACTGLVFDAAITDLEQIEADFKSALNAYYTTAKQDGVVKYNVTHALLTEVSGVVDFTDFTLSGQHGNVRLGNAVYPKTGSVTLEE